MRGAVHYREAERDLAKTEAGAAEGVHVMNFFLTRAQVHATLAFAAATAMQANTLTAVDAELWERAAGGGE